VLPHRLVLAPLPICRAIARYVLRSVWRVVRIAMFMMVAIGPAAPPPPLPRVQRTEAHAQSEEDVP
jgi:hypothetical protein